MMTRFLQIAARYSKGLEQLVEVLEEVHRVRPRFEAYASRFFPSSHKQLELALVSYHIELLRIFGDAIAFFKRGPFRKRSVPSAPILFIMLVSFLSLAGNSAYPRHQVPFPSSDAVEQFLSPKSFKSLMSACAELVQATSWLFRSNH